MIQSFSTENFQNICDQLGVIDPDLKAISDLYGYPPMWRRSNTFESLVHIILEQQVSLASAKAALNKLKERIGDIHPEKIMILSDEELKACYFSRQKISYVRHLSQAILNREFDFEPMETWPDEDIRTRLLLLKGIGNWTADIYLIFTLQRADIFPIGDLAAVNALKRIKKLSKETSRELVLKISEIWRPYRTVATMMLWHFYLSKGNRQ